jgi:hypothetical protein
MQLYDKNGVIAFCGSKFSGKSTSANIFKELIGAPTEEIAIAGHLKEAASRVFGLDLKLFLDPKLKEVELDDLVLLTGENLEAMMKEFDVTNYTYDKHIRPHVGRVIRTPRNLLQYIGTEVLHPIDPLIHIKKALRKKDATKLTVITDLRFTAEFDYLSTSTIQFLPAYVKNSVAEARASVDGHASERQFEVFRNRCRLVNNEGSLGDLTRELSELIGGSYEQD